MSNPCPGGFKESCVGASSYPNCACVLKDKVNKSDVTPQKEWMTYREVDLSPKTRKMRKL